jgi:hypothetical protein
MWLTSQAIAWRASTGFALRSAFEATGFLHNTNFCWAFCKAIKSEVPWRTAAKITTCAIGSTDTTSGASFSAFDADVVTRVINITGSAFDYTLFISQMDKIFHSTAKAGLGFTFTS